MLDRETPDALIVAVPPFAQLKTCLAAIDRKFTSFVKDLLLIILAMQLDSSFSSRGRNY